MNYIGNLKEFVDVRYQRGMSTQLPSCLLQVTQITFIDLEEYFDQLAAQRKCWNQDSWAFMNKSPQRNGSRL